MSWLVIPALATLPILVFALVVRARRRRRLDLVHTDREGLAVALSARAVRNKQALP